jgi:hypothetical protein
MTRITYVTGQWRKVLHIKRKYSIQRSFYTWPDSLRLLSGQPSPLRLGAERLSGGSIYGRPNSTHQGLITINIRQGLIITLIFNSSNFPQVSIVILIRLTIVSTRVVLRYLRFVWFVISAVTVKVTDIWAGRNIIQGLADGAAYVKYLSQWPIMRKNVQKNCGL